MSLGRATPARMDLAAFRLDEIEADRRAGVFRHRQSLRARVSRLFADPQPEPRPTPEPDHFVWHSIEDLLRQQR